MPYKAHSVDSCLLVVLYNVADYTDEFNDLRNKRTWLQEWFLDGKHSFPIGLKQIFE